MHYSLFRQLEHTSDSQEEEAESSEVDKEEGWRVGACCLELGFLLSETQNKGGPSQARGWVSKLC